MDRACTVERVVPPPPVVGGPLRRPTLEPLSRSFRVESHSSLIKTRRGGGGFLKHYSWCRLHRLGAIARARVKGQREASNSPCALLRPACPIEFGTGFLPPETGASKRDLKSMSPRRDRKLETTTREKSPQKKAFLVASCQLRVSANQGSNLGPTD